MTHRSLAPAAIGGIVFALAVTAACALTGCVDFADDEHIPPSDNPDGGVDATPTTPRLHLTFGGPPSGEEVFVGSQDNDVLCFQAEATAWMEIRTFRVYVRDGDGGLVVNLRPQYTSFKIIDGGSLNEPGGSVAGPIDPEMFGNSVEQTLVLNGTRTVGPGATRSFCVRMDVNANKLLDGHGFSITLLPFQVGDVVLPNGAPLAPSNVEPNTGLWTDLVIRGNVQPLVPEMAPSVRPALPLNSAFAGGGVYVFHRMTVRAQDVADGTVYVRKLTYAVNISTMFPNTLMLSSPQVWSFATQWATAAARVGMNEEYDCHFVADATHRCVTIVLAQPIVIPPGGSITIELRLLVTGMFIAQGDTLTTEVMRDTDWYQAGPLIGTGLDTRISGGLPDQMLWGNEIGWTYNGNHVDWGAPFANTLTR